MSVFQVVASVVAVLVGVGGLCGFLWAYTRVKGVQTSIGILSEANKALEDSYRQVKTQREDDRISCAAEIAELRGQVGVLTGEFGKQIAKSIIDAVKEN